MITNKEIMDVKQEASSSDGCLDLDLPDEFEEFRARSYSGGFQLMEWSSSRYKGLSGDPTPYGDVPQEKLANLTLYERCSTDNESNESYHPGDVFGQEQLIGNTGHGKMSTPHKSEETLKEVHDESLHPSQKEGNHPLGLSSDYNTSIVPGRRSSMTIISRSNDPLPSRSPYRALFSDTNSFGHDSLRTGRRHTISQHRMQQPTPPDIHVSVHRNVTTSAPPDWVERELDEEWNPGKMRPRVFSLPVRPCHGPMLSAIGECQKSQLARMRHFTITRKGLRKKYKEPRQGICSCDTLPNDRSRSDQSPAHMCHTCCSTKRFKVVLVGGSNVGKQTIIRRFANERDTSFSFDDEHEKSISIQLDGEESTLEFIDIRDGKISDHLIGTEGDAFVVIYSVKDRGSFDTAINRLHEVRSSVSEHVAVILVANKTDLVRSRLVLEEEGKAAANSYDSKFIEVSAAIGHNCDELLVGVLKQIRLIRKKYSSKRHWRGVIDPTVLLDSGCFAHARANVLSKLFKVEQQTSKSCENLYVL